MDSIQTGQSVLYLWNGEMTSDIEKKVTEIKGKGASVNVENAGRLDIANYSASKFDVVVVSFDPEQSVLTSALKLAKPKGKIILDGAQLDVVKSKLTLTGFVNISAAGSQVCAEKPNYEIGSSAKLSFAGKAKEKIEAVWKITDDDEEEIDPDELLDDEDKQKPDPSTLRVCGTTGKRKACKDCSCGLAEELASEKTGTVDPNPTQKSSCGSCYLGDAFRCASCPYLGMPAFKPGEKITLSEGQLKADV